MNNSFKKYKKYLNQMDNDTKNHSIRVAKLCRKFARVMNVDEKLAYKAGLVHDIGKMYVSPRIIRKNGRLTEFERQAIDLHSYFGYKLLKEAGEQKDLYLPVLYHHGFDKTKLEEVTDEVGEDTLRLIQLLHCVDIFDAVTSKRVYKEPLENEVVYRILEKDEMCPEILLRKMREKLP